jgi:hypothetical protein
MTKLAEALLYLRQHPDAIPYQAAQVAGMKSPAGLYRALTRKVCPACGRAIRLPKPARP